MASWWDHEGEEVDPFPRPARADPWYYYGNNGIDWGERGASICTTGQEGDRWGKWRVLQGASFYRR
jgi:hypothetical protein